MIPKLTALAQSVPLPLTQTFSQYAQLGNRIRKHYFSPGVFLSLVSGQFVPPIHRKNLYSLQYSMLPAQRVSIGELWRLLTRGPAKLDGGGIVMKGHAGVGVGGGGGGIGGAAASGPVGGKRTWKREKQYW